MTTHCSQCHADLNPEAQFCLQCGTPVAASAGPDNIALHDSGGTAQAPSAPEPDAAWRPDSGPSAGAPTTAWQSEAGAPAGPPPAGPPPAQVPYGVGDPSPLNQAQVVEAGAESSGGGFGKLAAVGLGVVGIGAVGFLALRFIGGGDGLAGGASSPEAVVEEMVEAINAQDVLAAISLMAPDELDGLDDVIEDATDYYDDLGVSEILEDRVDETEFELEIELEADRIDVSMEGDNAAIVSFELSGSFEASGIEDGMLEEETLDFSSRDLESALPNGSDEVEMIVIKLDGKWYASPMLTAGHYIVENADLPGGEYDEIGEERDDGADSAEEAIEALVDVINDPDADDLAAVLGGGEGRVAVAFRDAIDEGFSEIDTSEVRYDVSVETEDIGNGRVLLDEIELSLSDGFDSFEISIQEDCATTREDGRRGDRECLLDALELDEDEFDTTIWLDTVQEDGGHRVRIVPTVTDVLGRFIGIFEDRQSLLYAVELQQFDQATEVSPGSDIEIDFDGQRYTVHEFDVEAGESYNVTATGDTRVDVYVDDGFGLEQRFRDTFVPFEDGTARVVTYSEFDDEFDCTGLGCLPTGDGDTTLRIRQAARQSVPFPTVISGDLGPGDARIFELEVTQSETVDITVDGSPLRWEIRDDFSISAGGDTYDLVPGTYELVVTNTSGEDSTPYTITPTAS